MRMLRPVTFVFSLTFVLPVFAFQTFLGTWQGIYPDSKSDDIGDLGCQVCHLNPTGFEPWNEYGWLVRNIYKNNGFNISDAITVAADIDADEDALNVSSGDEINSNFQPGWREGANNSVYFKDGSTTSNLMPPVIPSTTGIDFPAELTNPISNITSGSIVLELSEVAGGFNAPLRAIRAPGLSDSLFVIEQMGKIYRVDLTNGSKSLYYDAGLDLVTINTGYDERGLLGMAFHPDFATNGLFYTYQSEPVRASQDPLVDYSTTAPPKHRSMIVEYQAADPSTDSSISKIENLLIIDQPQENHNGGDLAFGNDGYLYIAMGDGGGFNARGNGRDNTNPLGAILRIDVDGSSANGKYGVPNDNPFFGPLDDGVDEIFAYGFRNPFRFSFDTSTGDLYAGDVGQQDVEEINMVTNGGNYGWNWKEGRFYFYDSDSTGAYVSLTSPPGLTGDLIDPIAEYDHDDGITVIGGYVYRGSESPILEGRYVFADWNKRLLYLDETDQVREFRGLGVDDFVTGFGQDANSELYVVTNNAANPAGTEGKLLKISAVLAEQSEELCFPIKASNGNIALICL